MIYGAGCLGCLEGLGGLAGMGLGGCWGIVVVLAVAVGARCTPWLVGLRGCVAGA